MLMPSQPGAPVLNNRNMFSTVERMFFAFLSLKIHYQNPLLSHFTDWQKTQKLKLERV